MRKDDIRAVLEAIGADQILVRGDNVQCSCVFSEWTHGGGRDRKPSLGVMINPSGNSVFNCFSCGEKGRMTTLVEKLSRLSGRDLSHVMALVVEAEVKTLDEIVDGIPGFDEVSPWEPRVFEETLLDPFRGKVPKYALKRGLSLAQCKRWELGYDQGELRLVFPVRDCEGQLVGAVGRHVAGGRPKYTNYWKFEKGRYLYGEVFGKCKRVSVVVEGMLDCVKVDLAIQTFPNDLTEHVALATMGFIALPPQVDKMVRFSEEVVIAYDNDDAGREGSRKLLEALQRRVVVRRVRYPEGVHDPGEMEPEALRDLILAAPRVLLRKKEKERRPEGDS